MRNSAGRGQAWQHAVHAHIWVSGLPSDSLQAIAAELKASGKIWKDPHFGHDGYPGPSIGQMEVRPGGTASHPRAQGQPSTRRLRVCRSGRGIPRPEPLVQTPRAQLRDGERGKPLKLGSNGVSWQPPSRFCATKRPLGRRGDGVATWLYADDGTAYDDMNAEDVVQGGLGNCYFLASLAGLCKNYPSICDELIDETHEEVRGRARGRRSAGGGAAAATTEHRPPPNSYHHQAPAATTAATNHRQLC